MNSEMFQKERKEHPSFSDTQVSQIVKEHEREEGENEVTFAYRKLRGR